MLSEYLAIGCSHTYSHYLKEEYRWPKILLQDYGINFEYEYTSKDAAGLFHLFNRLLRFIELNRIVPESIKFLVIQKPEAIRFPWFHLESFDIPFYHEYNNPKYYLSHYLEDRVLPSGRKKSVKAFWRLSNKKKQIVADFILEGEKDIIKRIKKIFYNAKILYYRYWGDDVLTEIQRPELLKVNINLGEYCQSIGIENLGNILNEKLRTIKGIYKDNDLLMDTVSLYKNDWILGPDDIHPGPKFHIVLSEVIKHYINNKPSNINSLISFVNNLNFHVDKTNLDKNLVCNNRWQREH